jgi:hypothetical protein
MPTITDSARDLVRKIPRQPMLPSTAGLSADAALGRAVRGVSAAG